MLLGDENTTKNGLKTAFGCERIDLWVRACVCVPGYFIWEESTVKAILEVVWVYNASHCNTADLVAQSVLALYACWNRRFVPSLLCERF